MNNNHLATIFKNYIDHFETINGKPHNEYYKWQIAKQFRPMMDEALTADPSEFYQKIKAIQKLTGNLTDSGQTLPFTGLVKASEGESGAKAVQELFKSLYAEGMNESAERQKRVEDFLKRSEKIIDAAGLGGRLYRNTVRAVTVYIFLYDPDNNYIYKPMDALDFADCVEYYDDWGSGTDVNLDVYYRMCDQLVAAMKQDETLMATDASRFSDGWGINVSSLHPDLEKHILAFDIIHGCSHYGLFSGVNFDKLTSKERQLQREKKKKAEELAADLDRKRQIKEKYDEAMGYLKGIYTEGSVIHHKKYGDGIIRSQSGSGIDVDFSDAGTRKLGLTVSAVNNIITIDSENYSEIIAQYRDVLKKKGQDISKAVVSAEEKLAPYLEYLE